MFKKYNWQQPIFKNDVITVIIFGLTAAILGGILAGLIDGLMLNIGLRISFGLLIATLIVGIAVKKAYESYHILYPTLALCFLVIALFFSYIARFVAVGGIEMIGYAFSRGETYYYFILYPIFDIISLFKNGFDFLRFILCLLNIIFIGLAFYGTYRIAKGNN